jgi:hypothetical protein
VAPPAARRNRYSAFLRTKVSRRLRGYPALTEPHLDADGLELFTRTLAETANFLEYGSGGSTVQAAQVACHVVSVDNDPGFLRATGRATRDLPARTHLVGARTGLVGEWGFPLFTKPWWFRRRRWRRYVEAPWKKLRALGLEPDICFVDGRFRVACVLYSLLQSRDRALLILFDDYTDRPRYRAVERFADVVERAGRLVALRKRADFDDRLCRAALEGYLLDPA